MTSDIEIHHSVEDSDILLILKHSGLVTFLPENPDEICERLCMNMKEKQVQNDSKKFDDEIMAIIDKLSEYKLITPNQHKNFQLNIVFYKCFS